jgi:hypothetical protein
MSDRHIKFITAVFADEGTLTHFVRTKENP